jgi:hypothetical protein
MSRQCGILNISQTYRPPRPFRRLLFAFMQLTSEKCLNFMVLWWLRNKAEIVKVYLITIITVEMENIILMKKEDFWRLHIYIQLWVCVCRINLTKFTLENKGYEIEIYEAIEESSMSKKWFRIKNLEWENRKLGICNNFSQRKNLKDFRRLEVSSGITCTEALRHLNPNSHSKTHKIA